MRRVLHLAFGALFGWLLHQARATDYDAIAGMFRFTDLHLMGVMGVAIGTAAIGLFALRRSGRPNEVKPKPSHRWIVAAGAIFGAGWALTGA
jgi:hypothetical protein